ncbi:uncharacterized protein LOC129590153 isoform X2 [Paramacrobiotus metropolitanus]|uniref:uncharacterized protein LOC129590153 isoform X2 n=1 Tax=Paramacrobiotus metropolitanus TaxID=2943436 RepID=UPI002445CB55|nr:uncharacterized protein LOC129590153 isoform X2 [Paramacrobiotus metropolitanus]
MLHVPELHEFHDNPFHPVPGERDHVAVFHAPSEEAVIVPRGNSARQSIQEHMRTAFQKRPSVAPHKSEDIKVIPYVDFRQVLGVAVLITWPVLLGVAFNVYGFEEVSENLKIVVDVRNFQHRVRDVQAIVDSLTHVQESLLRGLLAFTPGKSVEFDDDGYNEAVQKLQKLDEDYPELREQHKRNTPQRQIKALQRWKTRLSTSQTIVDPDSISTNISTIIRNLREFFAAHHVTNVRGGPTWNNILQELVQNELVYRLNDTLSFGKFAYDGPPITERLRLTVVRRYMRIIRAMEMHERYAYPQFKLSGIKESCSDCEWTGFRYRSKEFWLQEMFALISLDNTTILNLARQRALNAGVSDLRSDSPTHVLFSQVLVDGFYAADRAQSHCKAFVTEKFRIDLHDAILIFVITLLLLLLMVFVLINLLGLFGTSLMSIFSESYRFQWIQLCRRRAIEKEKLRSDKIVSEMFFEVNFKYLYEGTLPPVVLYSEATVAFVELMQYEELCKIYNTAEHVALLDWYYHLVSNAVKGFNCSVVATAGHYCLLAGTHAYHAQNVALAMLRLMTMAKDSFLPPPHNSRLPLVKAGMHTGSVAGAILSLKFPLFTMLGDTVNTASRMNSKSRPYRILLSETAYEIVSPNFETKPAGTFDVKGKGKMKTFWLLSCNWRAFALYQVDLNEAEELTTIHTLHDNHRAHGHTRTAFGQATHERIFGNSGAGRHSSMPGEESIGGVVVQSLLRSQSKKRKHDTKSVRRVTYDFHEGQVVKPPPPVVAEERPPEKTAFTAKVDVKASPHESYYIQVSNSLYMRSWKSK